jgi:hypothetical protein
MHSKKFPKFIFAVLAMAVLSGALAVRENVKDMPRVEEIGKAITWLDEVIIAREPLHVYNEKNIVRFHPSGMVYVCFKDNIDDQKTNKRSIKLYSYDGVKSTMIKNVSENSLMAYEPDMVITLDGWIHISWAEAINGNANTQYIKYRYFDGADWSPITTLATLNIIGTTGGWNPEKLDDVRLAVDNDHNVIVGYMMWPIARCGVLSRYGDKVYFETFPMSGRNKHASVAVDENYVHVTWQQLEGSEYTIRYARRQNKAGAAWSLNQKIVVSGGHRPFVRVDTNSVPHLVYMKDEPGGTRRDIHYRIWRGSSFSGSTMVSGLNTNLYHTPAIGPMNAENVLIHSQTWSGGAVNYYNWMQNGKWNAWGVINRIPATSSFGECDLHTNGIAAVSYAADDSIRLVTSAKLQVNNLPVARITTDKDTLYWGETIRLDGAGSTDSDGTIVRYEWKILADGVTLDGATTDYTFLKKWGNMTIRLTAIDDKNGRGVANKTVTVKALYSALSVAWTPKLITTLIYNRNGYVVSWKANDKNEQAGYNIVSYRIFSKVAGSDDSTYVLKGTVGADKTAFADVNIDESKTYVYAVAAVDDNDRQSPYINTGI